jgi:Na+/H+ antiporter NhaC
VHLLFPLFFFFSFLFARANIYSRSDQEERATTLGGTPHPNNFLSDKEIASKLLVSDLASNFLSLFYLLLKKE